MNEKIKTLTTKEKIILATKAELKAEQDEIVNLQTYDLSHFTFTLLLLIKVTLIMMEHNFIQYFNSCIIL